MKRVDEFLKNSNKNELNILIASNLGDLDKLIKHYALKNKEAYSNFERKTVFELAKSIFNYFANYEYINNEESTILFYKFLNSKRIGGKKIYNLIPDVSFNIETAKICLKTINTIRKGKKLKDKLDNNDLNNLISDFEKYLKDIYKADDVLLYEVAINKINEKSKEEIESILGIKSNYKFGILYSNKDADKFLSYIESNFLQQLFDKLNYSDKAAALYAFEENKELSKKSYKTYGYYQEVENAIKVIDENKLPIQDTEIIVSDSKYHNSLKAYLDNYHIPYVFEYGESVKCFDQYGLIDSILSFFDEHYSITRLYDLYKNRLINRKYTNIPRLKDLKAVKEQIESVTLNWTNEQQAFIRDLFDINSSDKISILFDNIINFIEKYSATPLDMNILPTLKEKKKIFDLLDDIEGLDNLKVIRKILESISIDSVPNESTYLSIHKLGSINYLTKKHIFLIGLSSVQLNLKEIESPLLGDDELRKSIDCDNYYVELPSENNIRFNKKLDQLVKCNDCNNIYFSFSDYDSSEFRDLTESIFFINNIADEVINIDKNKKIQVIDKDGLAPILADNDKFNKLKGLLEYSPTSLNSLYKCPLQYLYDQYYEEISCHEYDNNWLETNESGLFLHEFLQEYYKEHNDKKLYKNNLDKIFKEMKDKYVKKYPFDNPELIDKYCNRQKKIIHQYIKDNESDGYRVLCCEEDFKKGPKIPIILNGKNYLFTGQIDRVDYKLEGDKILINVYDYKSGSKKTLAKDGLTQTFIYLEAIKYLINNDNRFSTIIDKNKEFEYKFHYVYFGESKPDCLVDDELVIEAKKANEEQLNKFDLLENNIDSYIKLFKPSLGMKSPDDHSVCTYCKFAKYCALKRTVSFNKIRS